jgi:hypothetical protein
LRQPRDSWRVAGEAAQLLCTHVPVQPAPAGWQVGASTVSAHALMPRHQPVPLRASLAPVAAPPLRAAAGRARAGACACAATDAVPKPTLTRTLALQCATRRAAPRPRVRICAMPRPASPPPALAARPWPRRCWCVLQAMLREDATRLRARAGALTARDATRAGRRRAAPAAARSGGGRERLRPLAADGTLSRCACVKRAVSAG